MMLWLQKVHDLHEQFIQEMDDDFNTANAISVLFELSKQANYYLMEKNTAQEVLQAFIDEYQELILCSWFNFRRRRLA